VSLYFVNSIFYNLIVLDLDCLLCLCVVLLADNRLGLLRMLDYLLSVLLKPKGDFAIVPELDYFLFSSDLGVASRKIPRSSKSCVRFFFDFIQLFFVVTVLTLDGILILNTILAGAILGLTLACIYFSV